MVRHCYQDTRGTPSGRTERGAGASYPGATAWFIVSGWNPADR